MPKYSWIRHLLHSLKMKPQFKSRRRRSRQTIEALEARMLLTTPSVVSINLVGAATTNATTTIWTATFSESVTGVDPTDFSLVETGTIGATLTQVTPVSGSVYTVTVSGITGNGTLGLNLVNNGSIHNLMGTVLGNPNGAASFTNQATFATGSGTDAVMMVDVNQDGKQDLVVTNGHDNDVGILLGNGNGTFQAQHTFATGQYPIPEALADVNGDGKADIVVANWVSYTVSVLLGNGDGTFQAQKTFATGAKPYSVAIGDINGDGRPDVVVGNASGVNGSISVLIGNGNGTFQTQQTFATGGNPRSTTLVDINGDNKLDVIVANSLNSNVGVLLGNGNGTFQSQNTFPTATGGPFSLVVGDLNGDGHLDVVTTNIGSKSVSVLLGNGNGTFQAQQTFATGTQPWAVTIGDLNGDGVPDLAIANANYASSGTVSVLFGNGNGTFQSQQTFATGNQPVAVTFGDANGDGRPDLIVASFNSNSLSVLLNTSGNFSGQVFTVDHVWPSVTSINHVTQTNAATNATSVSFMATFSEPVTGVDVSDFSLVETGTVGATTTQVTPVSTSVYTVTVSGIGGSGTLGLNLVDNNSIRDIAGNPLVGANAPASFANQTTFATGASPRSATTGDVNGDGKIDVIVANSGSNTVSVLLGNGNGTFQVQQTFATGTSPSSVAIADLNGDGKPDLIVADGQNYSVSVMLGNGNGTFQGRQTFSVGTFPSSVTAGDLNGDGKPDLIVANRNSYSISVLLGNGNGTFQAQQTFATGRAPISVLLGDVNGDGRPDLAVTNINGASVGVLLGNGNGTFQAQEVYSLGVIGGVSPYSLAFGDLNGDGRLDIAIGNVNGSNSLHVMVGNGNGTFKTPQTVATGLAPASVLIADLNGDGLPDIVDGNLSNNSTSVILGNGDGSFKTGSTFATGSSPISEASADFNGDGRTDLVVANANGNSISLLLANGNGSFTGQVYTLVDQVSPLVLSINRTAPVNVTTNSSSVSCTVTFSEAVTGVDSSDFSLATTGTVAATTTQVTPVSPSVYTVTLSGITGIGSLGLNLVDNGSIRDAVGHPLTTPSAAATFASQVTFATGSQPKSVTLGDVNGDGKPDLVVANFGSNTVSVMLGNGNGTFQAQQTFATGLNPLSATLADLNGDGKLDIIVADQGVNRVSVLLGNGNGTFQAQQTFSTSIIPYSVTVGDVNGDGSPDLVVANFGNNSVSVLLGNGNGTFLTQQVFNTGTNPFFVTLGDLNSDGKLDLVVANYQSNTVSVLLGNGNGTFQAQQTFATGSYPTSVAIGDLNGDGKPDLAVANRGGTTVSVLLGNGNGTFLAQQAVTTGTSPFSVTIGDVNGDGIPDLSVANYSNSNVSVLLGNGDGTFQTQQTFASGSFPIAITLGDVNSDGKPDVIVANSQSNTVSVLLGNVNGNFAGQIYTIATVPTLITPTSSSVTATAATLGGNVSSDGGSPITERGVIYSLTSINPNPHIGAAGATKLIATGTTGVFTVNASSLTTGVSYSFVAYAINTIGTTYTSPVSTFTTGTTLFAPTVTTPTSTNTTGTTAVLGGNVSSDGGSPITERGVVYSLSSLNPNPHISGAGVTKVTASGTTGVFTVNASSLTTGVVYSYAAYATNSIGTTYTSPVSTFSTGPLSVTGVYTSSGQPFNTGNTLTSSVTSVSVTFSADMNVVPGGANSVTNPTNWLLTRYGIDVSNEITGITFATSAGGLNDVAVVSFSLPLVQGGYQLIARQSLNDATGRQLDGDGDGVPGGDFRINFFVASTVNGVTDVGPWLYQIEGTPLVAPGPLATPVTSSLLVFDADSNNWTSATIQIAINYQSNQDVLGFVNTPNITGSWNAATGTLTLSGTDTVSNYRTALHNVSYHNTSATPNTSSVRTIDFQVSDGLLPSNIISRDVTVLSSSVPAVISGVNGTGTFFQGDPPITLAAGLVVTDPNTINLSSATISFTNWQGEDRLDFNNIFALQHTFTQDLVAHTATFMITGLDLVDHYQTLLRSVIYWDVSGSPVTSARVASFTVTDGLSASNVVTRNTLVSAVNQAPTLTAIESSPLFYKANDPAFPPQPISTTLLVGDPDSNNLTKATVQITSGYQNDANGNDVLAFASQLGITGSFTAATGILTLSGLSSVSNYRTALRSVTFSTSGSAVSTANRTLTIIATDDYSPTPANSLSTTRTVTVSTTNIPPALTGIPSTPLSYARGAAPALVASSAYIIDPDSINLASVTIQIASNYQTGLDVLAATNVTGISQAFNATTGTLTLSGIASLANYQTALQSVTFKTTAGANTQSRALTFILNDGLASSSAVTRSITLT